MVNLEIQKSTTNLAVLLKLWPSSALDYTRDEFSST